MSVPRLGLALRRTPDIEDLRRQARAAKGAGLDSLWMGDHITSLPVTNPVLDPFVALSALAAEAPGCDLGVSVTDVFRRNVSVLGQTAVSTQAMSATRFLLGLGTGEAMNLNPIGIARDRPLSRLKATVAALRQLFESSPEHPVDADGEGVALQGAFLQRPSGAIAPEILFGVNGPRGRALAGEVADGWLPILMRPEDIREGFAEMSTAAEAIDRDISTFRIAYHVFIGVADDEADAVAMLAPGVKGALLGFPHVAERMGVSIPTDFDWAHLTVSAESSALVGAAAGMVPDELVRNVALFGTPEQCAERLQNYADAGVTDFLLRTVNPIDELPDALRAVVAAVRRA